MSRPRSIEQDRVAFMRKVDTRAGPDGCWPWLGAGKGNGYGNVRKGPHNIPAHKRAYELFVGPVPDGEDVCHSCDQRWCVNYLNHLFPGTRVNNMADARSKGRLSGHYRKEIREHVAQENRRRQNVAAFKAAKEAQKCLEA